MVYWYSIVDRLDSHIILSFVYSIFRAWKALCLEEWGSCRFLAWFRASDSAATRGRLPGCNTIN